MSQKQKHQGRLAQEGLLTPYLRSKRAAAAAPHLKGRVLDVGCGTGLLANFVAEENYLGIDIDPESVSLARIRFPRHRFLLRETFEDEEFDTVVALAVLEHVSDPLAFLSRLRDRLRDHDQTCIVLTTPHPLADAMHWAGSRIGLFNLKANEEHQSLLGKEQLLSAAKRVGLTPLVYRRFLFGLNQLLTLGRTADQSSNSPL